MTEVQRVKGSPLDPIVYELYRLGKRRKDFVVYLHPVYLHRILREIDRNDIHSIGFFNQGKTIMGIEYIVSDWVLELPGWYILPRPKTDTQ